MAVCIVEALGTKLLYSETTHTMEPTQLSPSVEISPRTTTIAATTTTISDHSWCSLDIYTDNIQSDSSHMMINIESPKKRQLSHSDAHKTICETVRHVGDIKCALSMDIAEKAKEKPSTPTRPNSLFLTNVLTTADKLITPLRFCHSNPSAASRSSLPLTDRKLASPPKTVSLPELSSPTKTVSLSELSSPPTKRHRPQNLNIQLNLPLTTASPLKPITTSSSLTQAIESLSETSSSIRFASPTDVADVLKSNSEFIVFDCGSPLRHSENRVRNSVLLRVADKISRKRLKSNPKQHSAIDAKRLNECQFIILYDDNTDRRIKTVISSEVIHTELSPALRCAYDEIQHYLTKIFPLTLILNCPFNEFFDLYPHLCESLQPRSCPASPMVKFHSDTILPPQTAPPTQSSFSLRIPPTQQDIDNFPMTHIINGIFIGGEANAKSLDELSLKDIHYIVNVTTNVPLYYTERFQYCHLPADDTQKQNILGYVDQAYSFIKHALENDRNVLVHCVAGISRSPAIVIGFLMRYAKMNMNEAYDFVKKKRSIVSPNLNFMGQLLEYEKKLKQEQ